MKIGFGVDLGGTTVKIACFDPNAKMQEKWEIPTRTQKCGENILPDIAAAISGYMQRNQIAPQQVLGVGIGVPGPVRPDGTVNKCINLGWGVKNVEKELSGLTGFFVKAGNDASLAALGECWKGGGQGCSNMVFATLGTGVGGGIVVNGRVLTGIHGAGGEIGHMVINPEETEECTCGNRGCVEQYCSATGIVRLFRKQLQTGVKSCLSGKETITCKDIFDAAAAEDDAAKQVLQQVYAYMGQFLANICNVVDPEAVVLGGGVSKAGKPLLEGVQKSFQKHVFHAVSPVRFSLAKLGNDAGVYGAFHLVQLALEE